MTMHYGTLSVGLQVWFQQHLPLSAAQSTRLVRFTLALLLAGEVHLSKLARFLPGSSQQDSRIRWLVRLLGANYLQAELVYQPLLRAALSTLREQRWHLVLDRTALWHGVDLLTVSLNYRKRAIPLVWCRVPFGGADSATAVAVLQRCKPLLPKGVQVIVHGASEFGTARLMRTLRLWGWDFILAVAGSTHYRTRSMAHSQALTTLAVTRTRSCQRAQVELFATERLGALNVLAFYQPHHNRGGPRKRTVCYLATSLPLTAALRRLGRRRWGTEPFYRDYKSSGWHITWSRLKNASRQEGLLLLLAVVYLWSVCVGRWLCKTGRRRWVDAKRCRHLSLCRLGWDWLIHCFINALPFPCPLRLYS